MVAVGHSVEPGLWRAETDRLLERMAGRFARVETRHRTRGFVLGLLADLPRKNCWTIGGSERVLEPDRVYTAALGPLCAEPRGLAPCAST